MCGVLVFKAQGTRIVRDSLKLSANRDLIKILTYISSTTNITQVLDKCAHRITTIVHL